MNYSEWLEGPPLIALLGDEAGSSEYQLGSREYAWHQHARGQLLYVDSGLVQVRTQHGSWLLPPRRAGWIPPGFSHEISLSGVVSGWTLLLLPTASEGLPATPCVIGVSDALQALARRAIDWHPADALTPAHARIAAVIRDEIAGASQLQLYLPMPRNPRLHRIARGLLQEPGSRRGLEDWATLAAMSPRTLRRLVLAETGLTFGQWRQQIRLAHGLDLLARGLAVNEVADALGYASPSNFIGMFRRAFGISPARYFSGRPRALAPAPLRTNAQVR